MDDFSLVLHNGVPLASPHISILDPIVVRGDGCFEAVRSYGGAVFRLEEHLIRLERSSHQLRIALPPRSEIDLWVNKLAATHGDCIVQVFVSGDPEGAQVYVFAMPNPEFSPTVTLLPVTAPWHPAGADWVLSGVKSLSYAPNVAAIRTANDGGFDDALLVSTGDLVLEGPTSSVFWVVDDVIETPALDLGILASVTRSFALAAARTAGIEVREGHFGPDRLDQASEMAIMSTAKEIRPVSAVSERAFEPGPVTALLAEAYQREVERLRAG